MVPLRLQTSYCAAKAGVINLTQSMALEMGPFGVLSNCVCPGSTLTRGTRAFFIHPEGVYTDKAASLLSHVPLGRPGEPEEIASAVLFSPPPKPATSMARSCRSMAAGPPATRATGEARWLAALSNQNSAWLVDPLGWSNVRLAVGGNLVAEFWPRDVTIRYGHYGEPTTAPHSLVFQCPPFSPAA